MRFFLFIWFSLLKASEIPEGAVENGSACSLISTNINDVDFYSNLSYDESFNLFSLRRTVRFARLDTSKTVNPQILAYIIADNAVLAYRQVMKGYKMIGEVEFDTKILYKIMLQPNFMKFLDYGNCFRIIRIIFETFKPLAKDSRFSKKEKGILKSIAGDLNDFLEFVLEELTPRYNKTRSDPSFRIAELYEVEYPAMIILVEVVAKISFIIAFDEMEILRTILKRYSGIWISTWTSDYIQYARKHLGDNINKFRELFTILVKSIPDYFVHSEFMSQQYHAYAFAFQSGKLKFCEVMCQMAPIFRSLMLIDHEDLQYRYLSAYFETIASSDVGPVFNSEGCEMSVFEAFIRDSKFSFTTSHEMFSRKSILLETILSEFFGIKREEYLSLALYCLSRSFLAIFEVLLKYFGEIFTLKQVKALFQAITTNLKIRNYLIAGAMTIGYLDIENQIEQILKFIEFSSCPFELGKQTGDSEKESKLKKLRIRSLLDLVVILKSCPIKTMRPIVVGKSFVKVPWKSPTAAQRHIEEEFMPTLFYYAQAILCKKFSIPFFSVSHFESTMNEGATWSETIGFINLTIETMGMHLGYTNVKFFEFFDSTEY